MLSWSFSLLAQTFSSKSERELSLKHLWCQSSLDEANIYIPKKQKRDKNKHSEGLHWQEEHIFTVLTKSAGVWGSTD